MCVWGGGRRGGGGRGRGGGGKLARFARAGRPNLHAWPRRGSAVAARWGAQGALIHEVAGSNLGPCCWELDLGLRGPLCYCHAMLSEGETSTCFTGLDISQATPSAKMEWRQESGYSQHILSLKDNPHRLVHPSLSPSTPRPKTTSILQVEVARLRDSVASKVEKLALDAAKPTPD